MRYYRFWFVAFASAGVFVAAEYAGGEGTAAGAAGAAGWPNGLLPEAYHATKLELSTFMQTPSSKLTLAQHSQLQLHAHNAAVDASTAWDQGNVLVGDFIACALSKGGQLQLPGNPNPFRPSEGIMAPGADAGAPWQPVPTPWPGDITDARARVGRMEDIHTCLTASLNPSATPVPVHLSGLHVASQGDPAKKGFPHEEAVWLATIGGPTVQIDVWPLPGLARSCGDAVVAGLQNRICGAHVDAVQCGLKTHSSTELENDCKKTNVEGGGIWMCHDPGVTCPGPLCTYDRPAIATYLGDCAWNRFYDKYGLAAPTDPSKCSDPSTP